MYYRVIPYEKSFDTYGLIYSIPESYQEILWAGMLWEFPFGTKTIYGFLYEEVDEANLSDFFWQIRPMKGLVSEKVILRREELVLISFISDYYFCPIHQALKLYISSSLLKDIISLKYFSRKEKLYEYKLCDDISLTQIQSEIYTKISNLNIGSISLLFWVTGSGKTQIYMKIIEEKLKKWEQTLLLIPEILLSSQIGEKLRSVFWDDVLLLHSWISPVKKIQYFQDIASGRAKIIIGTRSSLFYSYKNLAAIIIDEEHDSSYNSDSNPRYNTFTIAKKMSEIYHCSLLLWSWTPQVTTMYQALAWNIHLFQMLESFSEE